MAGSVDQVVPAETVTRPSFQVVPGPSLLWVVEGVGHNGFDDFCTFGNGKGIIGVAEASGLGGLLDAQPQLRKLGEDGCIPPAIDVNPTMSANNTDTSAWSSAMVVAPSRSWSATAAGRMLSSSRSDRARSSSSRASRRS